MLALQMNSGEYLTIGGDIVIQVFREHTDGVRVCVDAPRDMVVLRGEILERQGAPRPGSVLPGRSAARTDARQKKPPKDSGA